MKNERCIAIMLIFVLLLMYILCCKTNKSNFKAKNNSIYTAVIVEPRKHKAMDFVLNNFLDNLSNEWNIIIFHGRKNKEFIYDIIKKLSEYNKDRITTVNLEVDNLSIEDYNKLLTSSNFYNYIPTETFLIFQTDSIIIPEYRHLINRFIDYDYVGAPWDHGVGNGGLSLRKKSKMLEVINNNKNTGAPEDVFFAKNSNIKLYKPNIEEAKLFSVETLYSDKSFGVHKPWCCVGGQEYMKKYPIIQKLYELNK